MKTFTFNNETHLYTIKNKTEGVTTTISYVPIKDTDINLDKGFARIQIWEDNYHNISHVVIDSRFSELLSNGQVSSSTSDSEPGRTPKPKEETVAITQAPPTVIPEEEILEGYIRNVYEDYFEIEIVTVEYIENLGHISSSTGITAKVQFDKTTSFTVQLNKGNNFELITNDGSKDDLVEGYRVKMYGHQEGKLFIAREIIINIMK